MQEKQNFFFNRACLSKIVATTLGLSSRPKGPHSIQHFSCKIITVMHNVGHVWLICITDASTIVVPKPFSSKRLLFLPVTTCFKWKTNYPFADGKKLRYYIEIFSIKWKPYIVHVHVIFLCIDAAFVLIDLLNLVHILLLCKKFCPVPRAGAYMHCTCSCAVFLEISNTLDPAITGYKVLMFLIWNMHTIKIKLTITFNLNQTFCWRYVWPKSFKSFLMLACQAKFARTRTKFKLI